MDSIQDVYVLVSLAIASCALALTMHYLKPRVGGTLLDSVSTEEAATSLLDKMTPAHIRNHLLITSVFDMLFPVALGLLFAGLTLRFFGNWDTLLALPALMAILVDIAENVVQILALKSNRRHLKWKALLTPAKFFLFAGAGVIVVFGFVMSLI